MPGWNLGIANLVWFTVDWAYKQAVWVKKLVWLELFILLKQISSLKSVSPFYISSLNQSQQSFWILDQSGQIATIQQESQI